MAFQISNKFGKKPEQEVCPALEWSKNRYFYLTNFYVKVICKILYAIVFLYWFPVKRK